MIFFFTVFAISFDFFFFFLFQRQETGSLQVTTEQFIPIYRKELTFQTGPQWQYEPCF